MLAFIHVVKLAIFRRNPRYDHIRRNRDITAICNPKPGLSAAKTDRGLTWTGLVHLCTRVVGKRVRVTCMIQRALPLRLAVPTGLDDWSHILRIDMVELASKHGCRTNSEHW